LMDLLQQFKQHIIELGFIEPKHKLLLAVSGGIDSVVLAHLIKKAGFEAEIAHCNFQLRGDESKRDEDFVRNLGKQLQFLTHVIQFDTSNFAIENRLSKQEAARKLRYDWFKTLMQKDTSLRWILTAHHADDNIETLMMHFFKGTGIAGLRAIPIKNESVLRPLLAFYREDIEKYANENNIHFVEDRSNATEAYTRNYFRLQLIPALEKVYPSVKENLKNNIDRFRDIELIYKESIDKKIKKLLIKSGNNCRVAVEQLKHLPAQNTLLYELFQPFGFGPKQTSEIVKLLKSDSGKYILSSTHRILKNRNMLIINAIEADDDTITIIETNNEEIEFPLGKLVVRNEKVTKRKITNVELSKETSVPQTTNNNLPNFAQIDASGLKFPLLLRKHKPGDYFYPLGMRKKKKVARFLIDLKLSKLEKENIWVLESDKKIIWVVNHRIDDRFKIMTSTRNLVVFKMIKED
jgi:tRNA(Ile)-lysidine synthase